jgi:DNA-binding NarL/FixJ family response regulator
VRIILADHHTHPRWALKLLLDEQPGFCVIGEAVDRDALLQLASEQAADLVLVDQELPGCGIEDLIAKLHAFQPGPLVVVMSSKSDYNVTMMSAGADAFISKTDQPKWLLEVLCRCAAQVEKKNEARNCDASLHSG